jgi:hypothetical protein
MECTDLIARLKAGSYGSSASEILALAEAAAEIDQQRQETGTRGEWLQSVGVHPDTWAKVVALGKAEALHSPDLLSYLPASFSTLALLARCSSDEITDASKEGLITPKLTYRKLAAWRKAREEQQGSTSFLYRLLPVAIAVSPDATEMEILSITVAIQETLDANAAKSQMIHLDNWEQIDEQATCQWQEARLEEARIEVNDLISPHHISASELTEMTLSSLKQLKTGIGKAEWEAVSALKQAESAIYGHSKQQRYTSRMRLQEMAGKGNPTAIQLVKNVLGVAADRNRNAPSETSQPLSS